MAAATLALEHVLQLGMQDVPGEGSSSGSARTFLVPLQLAPDSGEAAVLPAGQPAVLQVQVSYAASNCYDLEEAGMAAEAQVEPGDGKGAAADQHGAAQLQHPDPALLLAQPLAPGASRVSSPVHAGVQLAQQALTLAADPQSPAPSTAVSPVARPISPLPAAAGSPGSGLAVQVCMQVVRACGLQAAVHEAQAGMGAAGSLLGSAYRLGPNVFVTAAVQPRSGGGGEPVLQLRTAFQAHSFCPQFGVQEVGELTLNPEGLAALGAGQLAVELWHHCPRSQAVATALSAGQCSGSAMAAQQAVLLGSGAVGLLPLLLKPQVRTFSVAQILNAPVWTAGLQATTVCA